VDEIVLFIPTRSVPEKRLMRAIEKLVSGINVKVCRDLDALRSRLLPGGNSPLAVVILAVTKQDLLSVVPLRDLLLGFRVIVVLPDSDDVTLAMGWGMWPRFVSYADGDLWDVAGVLGKITGSTPPQDKVKGDPVRWASAKHNR
jgi:hypothetical protein